MLILSYTMTTNLYLDRCSMKTTKHYDVHTWQCLLRLGATTADIAAAYQVSVPTVYNKLRAVRSQDAPLTTQDIHALAEYIESAPDEVRQALINPRRLPKLQYDAFQLAEA